MNIAFLCTVIAGAVLGVSSQSATPFACTSNALCSPLPGSTCGPATYGCNQGICVCPAGQKQSISNTCVIPTVLLGAACTQDSDCIAPTAACTSGKCACSAPNDGTPGEPTSDGKSCNVVKLQSICNPNLTGCGQFASCGGSAIFTCECLPGYKATSDGYNCAPYAINDACDGTSQCGYPIGINGECMNNKCGCPAGTSWVPITYLNIQIGGCVLPSVQTNRAAFLSCTPRNQYQTAATDTINPLQICAANLDCYLCPDMSNDYTCQATAFYTTTTPSSGSTTVAGVTSGGSTNATTVSSGRNGSLSNHVTCPALAFIAALLTLCKTLKL